MKAKTIIAIISIMLLLLWIPVTLEKFWDMPGFLRALQQQPFPDGWAEILFWLVPALEGLCILLLVGGGIDSSRRIKLTAGLNKWGFALSTLLMLAFTLFILFGVLDLYEKRPCGCGSVIAGLTWNQHLWFNLFFLLISGWGWWLVARSGGMPSGPVEGESRKSPDPYPLLDPYITGLLFFHYTYFRSLVFRAIYPRLFAPFPGRPVCTCTSARGF